MLIVNLKKINAIFKIVELNSSYQLVDKLLQFLYIKKANVILDVLLYYYLSTEEIFTYLNVNWKHNSTFIIRRTTTPQLKI